MRVHHAAPTHAVLPLLRLFVEGDFGRHWRGALWWVVGPRQRPGRRRAPEQMWLTAVTQPVGEEAVREASSA